MRQPLFKNDCNPELFFIVGNPAINLSFGGVDTTNKISIFWDSLSLGLL